MCNSLFDAAAVFGLIGVVVGAFLNAWFARRTRTSNRVFELRIEALSRVWQAFNEMKSAAPTRIQKGPQDDDVKIANQASEILAKFRRAIDDSQVVLPFEVVDALRKVDDVYYKLLTDPQKKPSEFFAELGALLKKLTAAANKTMAGQTHLISIELRT